MKNLITVTASGAFKISEDLLKGISIRGVRSPFTEGEVVTLELTDQTEKCLEAKDNVEYPIFLIGKGRRINLYRLANLYIDDEKLVLANVGDAKHECLPFGSKPTTLAEVMRANGGTMPNSLTITRRFKEGASAGYLSYDSGVARKKGYELHGIDTTLESFPKLSIRNGDDTNVKENWKETTRIAISVI